MRRVSSVGTCGGVSAVSGATYSGLSGGGGGKFLVPDFCAQHGIENYAPPIVGN